MLKKAIAVALFWTILVPGFAPAAEAPDALLATIAVQAGEGIRMDTPVSVELPERINAWRQMRLVETDGGKRIPVAAQVEPGDPPRLWFVLAGETPTQASRTYELYRGAPVPGQPIEMRLTAATLDVSFKEAKLFSYNHAHVVPPKGIRPEFIRSGYIHPMFSPAGELLTEDFPADHHHHKGIWMPWTKTEFEGHSVDFWNLRGKEGTVQYAGLVGMENGPVFARFRVKHEHVDLQQPNGGKVVLDEIWDVRIFAVGGPEAGYWIWDLTSEQTCVADTPLHLKAYRYGGLGWRGPKAWSGDGYEVLTSEGKTRKDAHATRSSWCAHSGVSSGKRTTVVVMCHPRNERFPEPMRTWNNGHVFFNYVPPQKKDLDLEPGKTHTFRYRFYIHEGGIDESRARRAWLDFGAPPRATMKVAE